MPLTCIAGSLLCGLGIAEVLLWVLVFAIVLGILSVVNIFKDKNQNPNKKINALIAIVMAFFVLMSVPLSIISVITSMANSFVILAIALIVIVSLIMMATSKNVLGDASYSKYVAAALVIIAVLVFAGAGGLAFIGLSTIPAIAVSFETIVLVILGIAVLWLVVGSDGSSTTKTTG